jgi:hypothetical protein
MEFEKLNRLANLSWVKVLKLKSGGMVLKNPHSVLKNKVRNEPPIFVIRRRACNIQPELMLKKDKKVDRHIFNKI